MPDLQQDECRNRLLTMLSAPDFALLSPHLRPMDLAKGAVLAAPDQPIESVYFPETGVVSIVAISPDDQRTEAGLFGFDGFGPVSVVMRADRTPHKVLSQIQGHGFAIATADLLSAIEASRTLNGVLLRFVEALAIQTGFTALSNAVHSIDERLARWILMIHDRVGENEIHLTHDYIAMMLAVRRPSVTTALHILEGNRLIRSERGLITVRDRTALESFARGAYGKPEAAYRRLFEEALPA